MEKIVFNLRMRVAALRQFLRDHSHKMTEQEVNDVLDQIGRLAALLAEMEK